MRPAGHHTKTNIIQQVSGVVIRSACMPLHSLSAERTQPDLRGSSSSMCRAPAISPLATLHMALRLPDVDTSMYDIRHVELTRCVQTFVSQFLPLLAAHGSISGP